MYLNRLTPIGFIGGDAETKTIGNPTFTAFSVATQRSWKNSEGVWESWTEWHRCISCGKLTDFAATLKKVSTYRWRATFAALSMKRMML
jgi:single-strand DNA-binding protein